MIRAYISEDRLQLSIALSLVQQSDGENPTKILRIAEAGDNPVFRWEDLPDTHADVEPTIRLGDSTARAILEALARHYGGADDTRALRRDYADERQRVDRLTTSLAMIAQSLAGPVE